MFRNKTQSGYLPISWYLIGFMLVALIPAVMIASLSISKAKVIHAQAIEQKRSEAYAELSKNITHIADEIVNIAGKLAAWDETIAQFTNATYYQYWKVTRIHDAGRWQYIIDTVDLYDESGKALVAANTIGNVVIPIANGQPILTQHAGHVYLLYFHAISIAAAGEGNEVRMGYIGVRANIKKLLTGRYRLTHSDTGHVQWDLKDGELVSIEDGIKSAQLKILESPAIDAFTQLVRSSFTEYLIYIIVLFAGITVLLLISLGRPLGRLADHLKDIYEKKSLEIPEGFHGIVKISELESVRLAVNDYHKRFRDATATLVEKNEELMLLTYRDTLTGIYNRRAFESHLEQTLNTAKRENKTSALFYMDMDQFKVVNDTCGHEAGDELLKQVASVLQARIRGSDILARLGGDEFGVLLEGCEVDKATELAEGLCEAVRHLRFSWEGKLFDVSVSIGLVPITAESGTLGDVLRSADTTCYLAKDLGRNRVQIYQPDDKVLAQRYGEMQWVSQISQALKDNRFELHCQKIVPISDDTLLPHYELLIRMRDVKGKLVPPMAFLPAAERYNLMTSIDRWAIHAAVSILREQTLPVGKKKGLIAVNLSGQSLGDKHFLDYVVSELAQSDVSPELICFEITETAAITNLISATQFISKLRSMGCRFALDDFGSGLSSFGYLKNLQVDYLKIDGHFVKNILEDPVNRSIVEAINQIGHVMGILTIAEFVENEQILATIKEIGVDYVQGFGIDKPKPLQNKGIEGNKRAGVNRS